MLYLEEATQEEIRELEPIKKLKLIVDMLGDLAEEISGNLETVQDKVNYNKIVTSSLDLFGLYLDNIKTDKKGE